MATGANVKRLISSMVVLGAGSPSHVLRARSHPLFQSQSLPKRRRLSNFSTAALQTPKFESAIPVATFSDTSSLPIPLALKSPARLQWKIPRVPVTLHRFPSLEPVGLEMWAGEHLYLPLRRDLLHDAIVYEGDSTRRGLASSKTKWEVAGSHRKIRPQKGTGRARAGWRQSPLFRGGGKVFGPKPRDFSTGLNRKVYDRAWRIALSLRYRRGELIVVDNGDDKGLDMELGLEFERRGTGMRDEIALGYMSRHTQGVLVGLGFERGRTLFIASDRAGRELFFDAVSATGRMARALPVADVDVKDLLEPARVVIERGALADIITAHQSDLTSKIVYADGSIKPPPELGHTVFGL